MKRRVVITGMGAVSPVGNDVNSIWESIRQGKCGIAPITAYDAADYKVKLAAEVKNLNISELLDKKQARRIDRFAAFGLIASKEAFSQSGIMIEDEDPERCGVVMASGIGGILCIEKELAHCHEKGYTHISPLFVPMGIANSAAGNIALELGLKGGCTCVTTACASAANAIGDAFRQIRDGYAEVMLCGGAEACISELTVGGFTTMRALSESADPERASIPFDKERSGFVMGEGAGALVLEEYEHAVRRGAPILGEIAGYGATCDAYHMTAPDPEGKGAEACMRMAVKDAGAAPSDVEYINAHGTGTEMNDRIETAAVRNLMGAAADRVMLSSTKSMTGHLLGASGAVEAIITVLAIREGFIPATINYRVTDENCNLDIVPNEGRAVKAGFALSNSFGFGGHNATLAFRRV